MSQEIQEVGVEFKPGGFNKWAQGSGDTLFQPKITDFAPVAIPSAESQEEITNETTEVVPPTETEPTETVEPIVSETVTSETTEDSEDVKVENPAFAFARQLVNDGVIGLDEIKEDIDFKDIYNTYKESLEPKVKQEVIADTQAYLTSIGITDENIVMLQAIENGVPIDELYVINKYNKYTTLNDDSEYDKKIEVIKEWYKVRKLSDREIERNLAAIDINDETDAEFSDAKTFFGEAVGDYKKQQADLSLQQAKLDQEARRRNQTIIDNAVKMGKIGAQTLTSDQSKVIQSDIFQKTESIETTEGTIPVSPFEKYIYNFNNDLEFQLELYSMMRFKEVSKVLADVKKTELDNKNFIDAWADQKKKSASTSSIKKKELEEEKTNNRTSTGGVRFTF